MRLGVMAALALINLAGAADAATPDATILKPVHVFIDSFNRGDVPAAAATHNPAGVTIIDEVSPHHWQGQTAFADWVRDLTAEDTKNGITDEHVKMRPVTRIEADAAHAYVVIPAIYTFREHGVKMQEVAQMTFAMERTGSGWIIDGWSWTGPRPKRMKH